LHRDVPVLRDEGTFDGIERRHAVGLRHPYGRELFDVVTNCVFVSRCVPRDDRGELLQVEALLVVDEMECQGGRAVGG
jgi:hypothetical protein